MGATIYVGAVMPVLFLFGRGVRHVSRETLNEQIAERLEMLETDELRVIWEGNNRAQWSDQAFSAIEVILSKRGVDLPPQREPHHHLDQGEQPSVFPTTVAFTIGRWVLLGTFLIWVLLVGPVSEVGVVNTPLNISWIHMSNYLVGIQDIQSYEWLLMAMIDIKFLMTGFGLLTGILMLICNPKAVFCAKIYIIQISLWVIGVMLLINVFPFVDIYWQQYFSVIETEIDWDSLLNAHSIRPGWDLLWFTAKQYGLVLAVALIWFLFFQRSTWVQEQFGVKEDGLQSASVE